MVRGVKIPWDWVRYIMSRGFGIPWIGVRYTIGRGGQYTMERGLNIPHYKHFHIKDKKQSRIQGMPTIILLQVFIHV